jgi:hypothetical protein
MSLTVRSWEGRTQLKISPQGTCPWKDFTAKYCVFRARSGGYPFSGIKSGLGPTRMLLKKEDQ